MYALERELKQDFGESRNLGSKIRRAIRKKPILYYFGALLIGTSRSMCLGFIVRSSSEHHFL